MAGAVLTPGKPDPPGEASWAVSLGSPARVAQRRPEAAPRHLPRAPSVSQGSQGAPSPEATCTRCGLTVGQVLLSQLRACGWHLPRPAG